MIEELEQDQFRWFPSSGVGYYPVIDGTLPYDKEYFERYVRQSQTKMGHDLLASRLDFVARHYQGHLMDIGAGSGAFVNARSNTVGYDINPHSVQQLIEKQTYADPWKKSFSALTFWDSLEHIKNFMPLLLRAEYVFVSIPTFNSMEHVLHSKHFRIDEHYWYFTAWGLCRTMNQCGLKCVEQNMVETTLGREDIGSYAFVRNR